MFGFIYKHVKNSDLINFALKTLGIDLYAPPTKRIFKYPFLFITPAVISLVANILSLYSALQNFQEFSKVVHCVYMFVQGVLVLIKISILLVNGRKFQCVMRHLKQLAASAERREFRIWRMCHEQQHKVVSFYLLTCIIAGIVYGFSPIMATLYYFAKSGKFQLTQPYWALFPRYLQLTPAVDYTLGYILFVPLAWFVLPSAFGIDSLYCWHIFTISAHFRILQEKLRILAKLMQAGNSGLVKQKLNEFINYHCTVIELVNEFQMIFKEIVFTEVLFAAFLICLLMSQFGNIVRMADMPFICLFIVAITTELVIFCAGGQILKNRSNDLNISMNLRWYYMSPKCRSQLLLPLMRSQHECSLVSYFFEVDNPLLVWIFKTAWSFSAFLMAMNE